MTFVLPKTSYRLAPEDPLRRCAAGEITPELALSQLLSQVSAETEIETALGAAIWDALESREVIPAGRLANLQRLWNRQRNKVHYTLGPL